MMFQKEFQIFLNKYFEFFLEFFQEINEFRIKMLISNSVSEIKDKFSSKILSINFQISIMMSESKVNP